MTNCVCLQVEMFGVTADETGEESAQLLEEFVSLQKEMFSALELHYRSEHANITFPCYISNKHISHGLLPFQSAGHADSGVGSSSTSEV